MVISGQTKPFWTHVYKNFFIVLAQGTYPLSLVSYFRNTLYIVWKTSAPLLDAQ